MWAEECLYDGLLVPLLHLYQSSVFLCRTTARLLCTRARSRGAAMPMTWTTTTGVICVCSASQTCFNCACHLFSPCICTIPVVQAAYRDLHDTAAYTARAARDCLAACCDQTCPSQHLLFSLLLQSLLSPNCSCSTSQYHAPSSSQLQVCHRKAHACVR